MAGTGKFLKVLFLVAIVILFLSFALKPYTATGQYRFWCGLCKEGTAVVNFSDSWVTFWFLQPDCNESWFSQNESVEYHLIEGSCVAGFVDK